MLSAIPGISRTTARSLLRNFGSLAAIATATEEELRTARGVGLKRAASIREALDRASSPKAKKVG
jgi:ERCC4-type nuclease